MDQVPRRLNVVPLTSQLVGIAGPGSARAVAGEAATPAPRERSGEVPLFRNDPLHSGVDPGPDIDGWPRVW